MCGITGFWQFQPQGFSKEKLESISAQMALQLHARGPDAQGIWVGAEDSIGLGHRRLSIMDLSDAGQQPMVSHSKRYVLIYNGEVYNAVQIRQSLIQKGHVFRGHSDTEVVLQACEAWGVQAACEQFVGMFAFALWDTQAKRLFLARDRIGIKPLYYGFNHRVFFFGSQLKSFRPHPNWDPIISKEALSLYFKYNYVPTPYSIYEALFKLEPGAILTLDQDQTIKKIQYWSLETVVREGISHQPEYQEQSEADWVNALEVLLKDVVKKRMISDVPLGAFLSGGIDSSTVVALMQAQSPRPVKTFSIGFSEAGYNEAQYAKQVAAHLGTDHHELYLDPSQAQAIIPSLPDWYDEPFADVSAIPTFLVSKLAREHVTVALSGDGGDELFAGYNRYWITQLFWSRFGKWPVWLKNCGASSIQIFSPQHWDKLFCILPKRFKINQVGDKAYKLAALLAAPSQEAFYENMISFWPDSVSLVQGSDFVDKKNNRQQTNCLSHFVEKMQFLDLQQYLPDDILTKVDRASMAVSLEARIPLLDHRLIEFAWKLPLDAKLKNKQTKWLLRQVLDRYVPRKILDRPKMGFGVPIDSWLRGSLREWAESLLNPQKIKQENQLNLAPIQKRWQEHISGRRNWQYALWGVLMFQSWLEKQKN